VGIAFAIEIDRPGGEPVELHQLSPDRLYASAMFWSHAAAADGGSDA